MLQYFQDSYDWDSAGRSGFGSLLYPVFHYMLGDSGVPIGSPLLVLAAPRRKQLKKLNGCSWDGFSLLLLSCCLLAIFGKIQFLSWSLLSSLKGYLGGWQHDAGPWRFWCCPLQIQGGSQLCAWKPPAVEQHWDVLLREEEICSSKYLVSFLFSSVANFM